MARDATSHNKFNESETNLSIDMESCHTDHTCGLPVQRKFNNEYYKLNRDFQSGYIESAKCMQCGNAMCWECRKKYNQETKFNIHQLIQSNAY
uniref:Uncharacterized protein n=1 Tax=Arundo donax TaxID=35708 RepID=A0A0A9BKY8_ARUDO